MSPAIRPSPSSQPLPYLGLLEEGSGGAEMRVASPQTKASPRISRQS